MKKKLNNKQKVLIVIAVILAVPFLWVWFSAQRMEINNSLEKNAKITTMKNEEMMQELNGIMDYLSQLDNTVMNNQDSLHGITNYNETVSDELTALDALIENIENMFMSYQEKNQILSNDIKVNIDSILEELGAARAEIATSQTVIASMLSEIQETGKEYQQSMKEKFETVDKSMQEISTKLSLSHESIVAMIEILNMEGKNNQKELLSVLEKSKAVLSDLFIKEIAELKEIISENHYEMKLQVKTHVELLAGKMDSLHLQITESKAEIDELLNTLEENAVERQEDVRNSFQSLQQSLEEIRTDYSVVHEEIKSFLEIMQGTELSNHIELVVTLEDMENQMQESGTQNLSTVLQTISEMSTNYSNAIENLKVDMSKQFEDMNNSTNSNFSSISQKFEDMNISTGTNFNELSSKMENQFDNLNITLNNGDKGIIDYLKNAFGNMNNKFETVFQSVSNGKKLLASALLTKGVPCLEDATFNQIYQSILAIPQKIVIGVEQIPGVLTYEYHYHKNENGEISHTDKQVINGGCYTNPFFHVHTGEYKNGGGCYSVPIVHNHVNSCYKITRNQRKITGYWFTGQGTGHGCCDSSHGQNWALYFYEDITYVDGEVISTKSGTADLGYCCGLCIADCASRKGNDSTITTIKCGYSEGVNGYDLGCGKTTQTVEYYIPGCGFADGQIIGAHIVYDKNGISKTIPNMTQDTQDELENVIAEEIKEESSNAASKNISEETEETEQTEEIIPPSITVEEEIENNMEEVTQSER